jgi:hypothetical protein
MQYNHGTPTWYRDGGGWVGELVAGKRSGEIPTVGNNIKR